VKSLDRFPNGFQRNLTLMAHSLTYHLFGSIWKWYFFKLVISICLLYEIVRYFELEKIGAKITMTYYIIDEFISRVTRFSYYGLATHMHVKYWQWRVFH